MGLSQVVFDLGGELLTQAEDIVKRWKECLKNIHPPCPPWRRQILESWVVQVYNQCRGQVVKKLLSRRAPGLDQIHSEMLKALDHDSSLRHRMGDNPCGGAHLGGGSHF